MQPFESSVGQQTSTPGSFLRHMVDAAVYNTGMVEMVVVSGADCSVSPADGSSETAQCLHRPALRRNYLTLQTVHGLLMLPRRTDEKQATKKMQLMLHQGCSPNTLMTVDMSIISNQTRYIVQSNS